MTSLFRNNILPFHMAMAFLIIIACFAIFRPVYAQDSRLFTHIPPATVDLKQHQSNLVMQLQKLPTTQKLSYAQIALNPIKMKSLVLNVNEDLSLMTNQTSLKLRNNDDYSWFGDISNGAGNVILVVRGKNVTGTIRNNADLFRIHPLGNGLHAITLVDESKFPPEHPSGLMEVEEKANPASGQDKQSQPSSTVSRKLKETRKALDKASSRTNQNKQGKTIIDVLVAYTPAVDSSVLDPEGLIQTAIDETNQSYEKSNINIDLNLVHSVKVNYLESLIFEENLNDFQGNGDNKMDEIHQLRGKYSADVLVLLIKDPNIGSTTSYCGQAYQVMADANSAFAIVRWDCATGNYSFAHEIGHLQGARHDLTNDNKKKPYEYGHGYFHYPERWRTIMTLPKRDYTRIQHWSNPDVTYGGGWYVSKDGSGSWNKINSSNYQSDQLKFCRFDNNHFADAFRTNGVNWYVSYSGTGAWQEINTSDTTINQILLADFNNDKKCDVFTTKGGKWYVSYSGTGSWQQINKSNITIDKVRLADFNDDGKADVFATWGGKWFVSHSGTQKWQQINTSKATVDQIQLGDFDGDGKADVFATWGGKWFVSYGGTQKWKQINTSDLAVHEVRLGYFDKNKTTDVFATWGGAWYVSYDGTGSWKKINTSSYELEDLAFADFDGNGITDIFRGDGGVPTGTAKKSNNAKVLNETASTIAGFR